METNDLKFTTAGEYMAQSNTEYYINECGLKIDCRTGELYQPKPEPTAQCSPP